MGKRSFRPLRKRLAAEHPGLDVDEAIVEGRVRVDGRFVTNLEASVPSDASIVVVPPPDLQGRTKLGFALDRCAVPVDGAVALDVGAAAGGFTTALLDRGARRVYALDAGHGQLLGSLRQDARVVNLEATNVAQAAPALIPDEIDVVSVDVSYLALRDAVAQLGAVRFAPDAQLLGLVKPMFELGLPALPTGEAEPERAANIAAGGISDAGWRVLDTFRSAVIGHRGAVEWFVHATRSPQAGGPGRRFAVPPAGP